jgi:hypothetical protein
VNNQRSASNPKKPTNSRVIGSITTKPLEFLWIGSLKLVTSENYGEHGCSGSLNNKWVITNVLAPNTTKLFSENIVWLQKRIWFRKSNKFLKFHETLSTNLK